ncbi:hypothetical protein WR25_00225 [Diploscapter pachys]|uniref:Uncharacterized protein n=1 Tax=Diploscapter pachys TaxID=2018661 RepID=A0A2A2K2X1_9BILA|nr:hypothetical protein WR25_00225 [Diploscapter pachys]
MLLRLVGADEREAFVGPLAARRPGLLPVDEIMVALVLGEGLQAREIGAGAGFGIALTPAHLAARDGGDMLLLLGLGAIFEERRAEHHHAHAADRIPSTDPRHFLLQHAGLGPAEATTTILRGPSGDAPPLLAHRLRPGGFVRRGIVRAFDGGHAAILMRQGLGEMRGQPIACFLPEGVERIGGGVGGEGSRHHVSPDPESEDRVCCG